jgi:diacylglycerol kinase (ATP)
MPLSTGPQYISFVRRLLRATLNTWNGLCSAMRTEEAFRQELWALLIAVPLAFLITAEPWKRVSLIAIVLFLMIVELLNTAIEKLADRITLKFDTSIGQVKDMASAAVGVALLLVVLFWACAIFECLLSY